MAYGCWESAPPPPSVNVFSRRSFEFFLLIFPADFEILTCRAGVQFLCSQGLPSLFVPSGMPIPFRYARSFTTSCAFGNNTSLGIILVSSIVGSASMGGLYTEAEVRR